MIRESLKKLESSQVYKDWKTKHEDSYLVHLFRMFDKDKQDEVQIGYYNKDHSLTTFILNDDIKMIPESKIFQEKEQKVEPLDMDKVKIDMDKAMEIAEQIQKEHYSNELPIKKFTILQIIEDNQVYNVTFLTQSFQTLNIKIDSESGEVKARSIKKLVDLG